MKNNSPPNMSIEFWFLFILNSLHEYFLSHCLNNNYKCLGGRLDRIRVNQKHGWGLGVPVPPAG